ncbi:hypothetical protein M0804_007006 [Polistes exclamans]|nr:hypothetical protein M0804_007006 [Polistes exclamans]
MVSLPGEQELDIGNLSEFRVRAPHCAFYSQQDNETSPLVLIKEWHASGYSHSHGDHATMYYSRTNQACSWLGMVALHDRKRVLSSVSMTTDAQKAH